jgi:hypothetical protein
VADAALLAAVGHALAATAYAGFQWTVHVVVYPQMAEVPAPEFAAYEASHQRRVTWVVGPLFAALVLSTVAVVVLRSQGPPWPAVIAAAGTVTVLAITAAAAVPLHRRLSGGWDAAAHRRLTGWDAARTAAASLQAAAAVAVLVRQLPA